jgi:hypothetical protein
MEDADAKSTNEFKEKLKSIQFGMVKGAYRSTASKTYFDKEALPDWPSKEEIQDYRSEFKNAPEKEITLEGQPEYKH